jgi:hypothetical protein
MTRDDMLAHVMELCEGCGPDFNMRWCRRPAQSRAIPEAEEIQIAPIKSAISYAVALHELGHILGRHQTSKNVIVRERWAWRWARAHARGWTPTMDAYARRSMQWYESRERP